MTQLLRGLGPHHLSRISHRIILKCSSAASRAEVMSGAHVVGLLRGGGWVDAHPTNRVSDEFGPWLGSPRMSTQHLEAASGGEAPGHNRYQDQECDIEDGRVVPAWLGFEDRDVVVC